MSESEALHAFTACGIELKRAAEFDDTLHGGYERSIGNVSTKRSETF